MLARVREQLRGQEMSISRSHTRRRTTSSSSATTSAYGARPLRRVIQNMIEDALAEAPPAGPASSPAQTIVIDTRRGGRPLDRGGGRERGREDTRRSRCSRPGPPWPSTSEPIRLPGVRRRRSSAGTGSAARAARGTRSSRRSSATGAAVEAARVAGGLAGAHQARPRSRSVPLVADAAGARGGAARAGIGEVDRVLGGGIVPGLARARRRVSPGSASPRSLLAGGCRRRRRRGGRRGGGSATAGAPQAVLYASGEESVGAARASARAASASLAGPVRGRRPRASPRPTSSGSSRSPAPTRPALLIVDSIQTVTMDELDGTAPVSVGQVREIGAPAHGARQGRRDRRGAAWATSPRTARSPGPKTLEHLVDAVLDARGRPVRGRCACCAPSKNRFGSTEEVGVLRDGRSAASSRSTDPARAFLGDARRSPPRAASVAATMGGHATPPCRGAGPRGAGLARHPPPVGVRPGSTATAWPLIIAVLGRRAGIALGTQDVYANLAGGLPRFAEPGLDLPIALALASSLRDRPVGRRGWSPSARWGCSASCGPSPGVERRLREEVRLGSPPRRSSALAGWRATMRPPSGPGTGRSRPCGDSFDDGDPLRRWPRVRVRGPDDDPTGRRRPGADPDGRRCAARGRSVGLTDASCWIVPVTPLHPGTGRRRRRPHRHRRPDRSISAQSLFLAASPRGAGPVIVAWIIAWTVLGVAFLPYLTVVPAGARSSRGVQAMSTAEFVTAVVGPPARPADGPPARDRRCRGLPAPVRVVGFRSALSIFLGLGMVGLTVAKRQDLLGSPPRRSASSAGPEAEDKRPRRATRTSRGHQRPHRRADRRHRRVGILSGTLVVPRSSSGAQQIAAAPSAAPQPGPAGAGDPGPAAEGPDAGGDRRRRRAGSRRGGRSSSPWRSAAARRS